MPSKPSRGYLSLHPALLVLGLVFIGVAAWRGWLMLDRVAAAKAAGAVFRPGYESGVYMGVFLTPLVVLAVAGGVGAAAYFLARKSQGAANAGMGVVLLAAAGLYGYSAVIIAGQPRVAPRATASAPATQAPLSRTPPASPVPNRLLPPATAAIEPQSVPPAAKPAAPGEERPRSTLRSTRAGSLPKDPRLLAEALAEQRPDAAAALKAAAGDLTAALDALIPHLDGTSSWTSPPQRERRAFSTRAEAATALENDARAYLDALNGVESKLTESLMDAGISREEAASLASRFATSLRLNVRRMGAEAIKTMAAAQSRECELLLANLNAWKYGRDGHLETSDSRLRSQVGASRFEIESTLKAMNIHRKRLLGD